MARRNRKGLRPRLVVLLCLLSAAVTGGAGYGYLRWAYDGYVMMKFETFQELYGMAAQCQMMHGS
jgi:hypothetical protein